MKIRNCIAVLAICVAASTLTGCGGGGGLPEGETGTVSGKVTYNGQPVPEGSTVVFLKSGGGAGVSGNAATDTSGAYQLRMRNGTDILAGSYMVGVSPPAPPVLSDEEYMKQSESAATGARPPAAEEPKLAFPAKYVTPESSGLTFEVKAGENTFDITMED